MTPTPSPPVAPGAETSPTPAGVPTTVPTVGPAAVPTVGPTAGPERLQALSLRLVPVASDLAQPVQVTQAGDGSGRLFVVERGGRIRVMAGGKVLPEPFLDITDLVGARGSEQGLLSVAFHPQYTQNGRFFVNYTDRAGDTVVAGYRVGPDPNRADPDSAQVLLQIDQPYANHNGGLNLFGPDGYLYIGMGDGGSAGDPHENGQSRTTLLGKLLRIDVDRGSPYAIPPDNPFVGRLDGRPEIWAYGLRNPWRFSFDRATGDLFIADVGQNAYEEVHRQPAGSQGGENYGWSRMEGAHCFKPRSGCDQSGLELPIAEYSRDGGCSITGGYVYRGRAEPALAGVYFFGDYCSGKIWGLIPDGAGAWRMRELIQSPARISSFGEDQEGELYLTDLAGGRIYRLSGAAD